MKILRRKNSELATKVNERQLHLSPDLRRGILAYYFPNLISKLSLINSKFPPSELIKYWRNHYFLHLVIVICDKR